MSHRPGYPRVTITPKLLIVTHHLSAKSIKGLRYVIHQVMQELHTLVQDMKVQHTLEMVTWHSAQCTVTERGLYEGKESLHCIAMIATSFCAWCHGVLKVAATKKHRPLCCAPVAMACCASLYDNLPMGYLHSACKVVGPAVFTIIPTPSFDSPVDLACTLIDSERSPVPSTP